MKIKCTKGIEHTISEARDCPDCRAVYPTPILHSLLHGKEREAKPREKPQYGVGTLVDPCLRNSYYKLTQPEVLELQKLWIFSRGHAIHSFITQTLDDQYKEVFVRKEFSGFNVIGFIDAKHEGVIYEFKTTNNIPELPQKHHVLQAQGYYSMLSPEEQEQIQKIIIVYLSLQNVKHFEVPKANIIHYLEGRAAVLTKALKDKKPPQKEMSWRCSYCEHADICSKEDTAANLNNIN